MLKEERYSRQLLLKGWNQELLRKSTVTIVGMGALGSIIALSLAQMGVGKLKLIDMDTIEISNLSRQVLYRDEDVGKYKAEVSAQRIKTINPDVIVEYYIDSVQNLSLNVFKETNVFIDGLDNFEARRYLNSLAVHLNVPLVSGGIYGFWGNVQVIIPYKTACLECQTLLPPERLQKSCTPIGTVRKESISISAVLEEKIPTISTVATVIGGLMANEVIKILMKRKPLENYLFWDGEQQIFTQIPLQRRKDCVVCSEKYRITGVPFVVDDDETINEFLVKVGYAFGLQDPQLIIGSQLFSLKEKDKNLISMKLKTLVKKEEVEKKSYYLYIIDKQLSRPIKLIIQFTK